jgi:hemoglobin
MFQQLGGEVKLREIIDDFVDRVFSDTMIGFFFVGKDRTRIREKEFEFAAAHLGAGTEYTGRPLAVAHAPHAITGGHFMRRLQILRETLRDHAVEASIVEHWLAHNDALRSSITRFAGSECDDDQSDAGQSDAGQSGAGQSGVGQDAPQAVKPPGRGKREGSIAEINAYLEASAKRTKKRLPLSMSIPEQTGKASGAARALPLVGKGSGGDEPGRSGDPGDSGNKR